MALRSREKTIIVAFDGLDKDLVEKFDLKNLQLEEYGTVDNKTGVSAVKTSELFISLITGKYYSEHGCTGLDRWVDPKIGKIESLITSLPLSDRFKELRKTIYGLFLDDRRKRYTKEDYEEDTVFEKVEDSRAMFIPGYNPSVFWLTKAEGVHDYDISPAEFTKYWDTREYRYRKEALLKELDSEITEPRDLLMCHFHRPDQHQHYYGDKDIGRFNEDKLRKLYKETDELAGKITEKAREKGYTRIIFLSDHGLPTATEHNQNAFYTSNKKLFGDKIPKIVDFHDLLTDER